MTRITVLMVSFVAVLAALALGIAGGGEWLAPSEWRAGGEWNPVFMLRLMRQLTAFSIGASLALSGAVF